jgi:hypothetical protein
LGAGKEFIAAGLFGMPHGCQALGAGELRADFRRL